MKEKHGEWQLFALPICGFFERQSGGNFYLGPGVHL